MPSCHCVVCRRPGRRAPDLAQQSKVGDWSIEKRTQDTHCNASRGYKDKDDENREYVIVITYSEKAIVIVMSYDGWEWDKVREILRADVGTDAALKFCEENRK